MSIFFKWMRVNRSLLFDERDQLPIAGNSRARRTSGFSLIEILITVAILGISMAIAVPNLSAFLQNGRITATSNELLASLNYARSEAIKRRVNVVVCNTPGGTDLDAPDIGDCANGGTDWSGGWMIYVNDPVTPDFTILRVQAALADNVVVTTNLDALDLFQFNQQGFVIADNGYRFSICDDRGPDEGRLLQIERTGRSRVVSFDDAAAVDCSV